MKKALLVIAILVSISGVVYGDMNCPTSTAGIYAPTGNETAYNTSSYNNYNNGYNSNQNGAVYSGYQPNSQQQVGQQQIGYRQPQPAQVQRPTMSSSNRPSDRRRVAITFKYIVPSYDSGEEFVDVAWWFENYFKQVAIGQNLDVVVWGESLAINNAANDYIAGSGRYAAETIPIQGAYEAPSQMFILTVRVWKSGFVIAIGGNGIGTTTAHVEIGLEVNDLQRGITKQILMTHETAKGLSSLLSLNNGLFVSLDSVEDTLTGRAARKAINKVLKQIKKSA